MKRRRTRTGYRTTKTIRPKNKGVIVCLQTPTTTQDSTVISGTSETFPYTFKMRKMSISAIGEATQSTLLRWALVKVPVGYTLNTLGATDGSTLYTPDDDLLDFGTMALSDSDSGTGSTTQTLVINTRISRKMQAGDLIYLVTDTNNASAIQVIAIVEFYQWL